MFYSHEILTSREYGVATVWLAATLGSKFSTKKLNRQTILDVDVPKACGTIMHPEAPMALRLQGNLLYGVSRVYNQQCGYALTDAQAIRDRMMTMLKAVRGNGLDPDAGKVRPDQLVLPHDPTFVPDLMLPGLNLELSALGISTEDETRHSSSLLWSQSCQSSRCSRITDGKLHLNVSPLRSHSGDADVCFGFASSISSTTKKGAQFDLPSILAEECGVLLQPDFEFDEEGNIIELAVKQHIQANGTTIERRSGSVITNRVMGRVEEDSQAGKDQFGVMMSQEDDMGVRVMEELNSVPAGELFPSRGRDPGSGYPPEIRGRSEVPETQMRFRKKPVKTMDPDDYPELRNSDLAQWNAEYAHNMAIAARLKQNNKLVTQAKKNAAFWVLGCGIGSVGVGLGISHVPHPLNTFSGERLLRALAATYPHASGKKRSCSALDGADSDSQERRVRMRHNDSHFGHTEDIGPGEGPELVYDQDIEIGRHAPLSLHDDVSSQLPWNITASIQGSRQDSSVHSRPLPSSAGGHSSVGGPRPVIGTALHGSMAPLLACGTAFEGQHRGLMSPSPLAGRGITGLGLEELGSLLLPGLPDNADSDVLTHLEFGNSPTTEHGNGRDSRVRESFEVYGSFASIDTQTAAQRQWLSQTLDQQSVNFLEFLRSGIENKLSHPGTQGEQGRNGDEIPFSSLLPPASTSRIVATQALLHVLTLATKGLLRVRQDNELPVMGGQEELGEIFIGLER